MVAAAQWKTNLGAAQLAWISSDCSPLWHLISSAVAHGIAVAFGKGEVTLPLPYREVLPAVPGYKGDEDGQG